MKFTKGLDRDLSNSLLAQIRKLYVHSHVTFVRIHPFFDGNGRMARLLANIPVLKAGLPPILIADKLRKDYITALSGYELAVEQPELKSKLLPPNRMLDTFINLCKSSWAQSTKLVASAHALQISRNRKKDQNN